MKMTLMLAGLLTGVVCGEMKVEVSGLRVVAKGYSSKGDDAQEEIRAFNWSPGTSIALMVTSSDLKIVKLNEEASKITTFTDDKGTDFSKVKSRFSNDPFKFDWSEVSTDGMALGTTLQSEGLPARGAKEIVVKGELVVVTGSKFEEKKSEKIKAAKGAKFEAGEFKFELSEVGKPDWGDAAMEITIKTSQDLGKVQAIRFYGADGKEVESESTGQSSFGFLGKQTYSRSYQFKKNLKELVIGVSLWTDLKEISVPLDLSVGAGL